MDSSFVAVFSTVCIFLSAFDFFFSYRAFQKTEKIGKWLGLSAASAGVVTLSYLYSILTLDYLHASILSSIGCWCAWSTSATCLRVCTRSVEAA